MPVVGILENGDAHGNAPKGGALSRGLASLHRHLSAMYGMDPRSIVALRIWASVVIILDCWGRTGPFNDWLELEAFYGPNGLWPREAAQQAISAKAFVMHCGVESVQGLKILFLVEVVAACFMLVGKNTRFATFLCWILATGSQRRNHLINHSGDTVLRFVLMWMLFLPESGFSLDTGTLDCASLRRLARPKKHVFNAGTLAMTLQLGYLYAFSVCQKSYTSYAELGDVVLSILQFEHYVSSNVVAQLLLDLPSALWYLSVATFWTELAFGVLTLFPVVMPQRTRLISLALLTLLQIGLLSSLYLGTFPWICLMLHLACLPSYGWDLLLGSAAADTDDAGDDDAGPPSRLPSWRSELAALFLAALALLSNLNTLPKPGTDAFVTNPYRGQVLPEALLDVQEIIGGRQVWNMFTFRSDALKVTGRNIVDGTLSDGSRLDLLTMTAWDAPHAARIERKVELETMYTNFRWRAYWAFVWGENQAVMIDRAQLFFCHKYNRLGYRLPGKPSGVRLENVTMYRVGYATRAFVALPEDYPTEGDPLVESLGQRSCH